MHSQVQPFFFFWSPDVSSCGILHISQSKSLSSLQMAHIVQTCYAYIEEVIRQHRYIIYEKSLKFTGVACK